MVVSTQDLITLIESNEIANITCEVVSQLSFAQSIGHDLEFWRLVFPYVGCLKYANVSSRNSSGKLYWQTLNYTTNNLQKEKRRKLTRYCFIHDSSKFQSNIFNMFRFHLHHLKLDARIRDTVSDDHEKYTRLAKFYQ